MLLVWIWSDNPAERLAAARDPRIVGDWRLRIGACAPMQPWPYGMPTSINPVVLFLGASLGGSPPTGDPVHQKCEAYDLPTAGQPHLGLYVPDRRNYWDRVREAGMMFVQAHQPGMPELDAHALIGQLNLGTGQFGRAENAPLEPSYCRWVPEAILDHLRPSYVVLLGLKSILSSSTMFDPAGRLGINWRKPDERFPFIGYTRAKYSFRLWRRMRPHGGKIRFVLWPQPPTASR